MDCENCVACEANNKTAMAAVYGLVKEGRYDVGLVHDVLGMMCEGVNCSDMRPDPKFMDHSVVVF